MVKFKIFNVVRKSTAELLPRASGELTWGAILAEYIFEGQGVQKCWSIFRNYLLEAQEKAIPWCFKSSKWGRRPPWLNRELLMELKRKRKLYDL